MSRPTVSNLKRVKRYLIVVAIALLPIACTVGPDYKKPAVELADAFDQSPPQEEQQPIERGALWTAIGDQDLQTLLQRARVENHDLEIALARLNEVRALRGLSFYSLFPTVRSSAVADRSKPSQLDPNLSPDLAQINESYRLGFDAIWEIDLFGSLRRQKEAIVRDAEAARARLDDVQRIVEAEVAQAYFALRGAKAQLSISKRNVANLNENVKLLELALEAGRGIELDVSRQRALGLSVAATIPGLEAEIVRHEQRLAVLTAQDVQQLRDSISDKNSLPPPVDLVVVGRPEQWIRRRPDVSAAERDLAAATARIGVQVAEFYPKLNLTGSFGWTAATSSNLLSSSAERWQFGPVLSWSFLDFGRVKQRVLAAEANADGALAAFEKTILQALEETENALAGFRAANQASAILEQATSEAIKALYYARLRHDSGAIDYLAVLDAERTALELQTQATTAATNRATALVTLYKALAGDFVALTQDSLAEAN
ncbi:MAG: multidrug efflux outer membrane protein OprN [Lysobacteraceae bacterium]|nr:MAG: multidrug efflux outer membrane protein OprN [Xanthomonadaceae bacterium]